MNIITCNMCGEDIETEYTAQELYEEFSRQHPDEGSDKCIICDDCYKILPADGITIH